MLLKLFHIIFLPTANNEQAKKQHTKISSQTKLQLTNDTDWSCVVPVSAAVNIESR